LANSKAAVWTAMLGGKPRSKPRCLIGFWASSGLIVDFANSVTNWAEYDAALRRRGNLTVWFTDDAIDAWRAEPRTAADSVDRFLGDGTYDRTGVYTGSVERLGVHAATAIPAQGLASVSKS
jgi:hypothetical protein